MFLFRRAKKVSHLESDIAHIFEIMGNVFYDFGLVSDKWSWLAGRYQMPIAPREDAILVSGWLKIPIKTDLLPRGVFLSNLSDERLITALRVALDRNVEFFEVPVAPTPSSWLEKSVTGDRYPAAFEFWYFVELDSDRLHGISRFYDFSLLPPPSRLNYSTVPIPFGFSVGDKFEYFDLSKIVGALVCGATDSGKSVFLRQIIDYLLCHLPTKVQFILADFKEGVEFEHYISHPNCTLANSPSQVLDIVECAYRERFDSFIKPSGVRKLSTYNQKVPVDCQLPYILVIVDEFSEFILEDDRKLMKRVYKLASRTRAAGIHWILGTQRPSVDIVPGVLKAQLGARISFSLASTVDAEVVFDLPEFRRVVSIGCPGRAWALVGDKLLEFQSTFVE